MKYPIIGLVISLLLVHYCSADRAAGFVCAGCTVAIDLIEQVSVLQSESIDTFIQQKLCTLFQGPNQLLCQTFVATYGPAIITAFVSQYNADYICHNVLNLCDDPTCLLLSNATRAPIKASPNWMEVVLQLKQLSSVLKSTSERPGIDDIASILQRVFLPQNSTKLPLVDNDKDGFSTIPTNRGYNWRGRDCDDNDPTVYAGRMQSNSPDTDYNCNGIYGVDGAGKPYKDSFCMNSGQMGVAVIGDSAGAHFELPPKYFTPKLINSTTFDDAATVFANEVDLPHRSAYTGYEEGTPSIPINSFYKKLRARNLCNHRDFQNIAVNGGDSYTISGNYMYALSRDQQKDHPMIVFVEIMGNDVCDPKHSFDIMTPPPVFKANVIRTLQYLNTRLPAGSHVFLLGLVDGRILYDNLWNHTHPIGVTYQKVYEYLNCNNVNPCWGWLNSNETIRNLTTQHANSLIATYSEIEQEFPPATAFSNFDYAYYDFPQAEIINYWVGKGGSPADLIEPVDGFHPNQLFNAILGEWLWDKVESDHPDWIGNVNPNNYKITSLFGDQGGLN